MAAEQKGRRRWCGRRWAPVGGTTPPTAPTSAPGSRPSRGSVVTGPTPSSSSASLAASASAPPLHTSFMKQYKSQAMKDHNVGIEEVNIHIKEVDDLVAARREIDAALESVPLQLLDGEEDIEEEFSKMEAELQDEIPHMQVEEPVSHANEESPDKVIEPLSNNLSNIKLEAIYTLLSY